MTNRRFFLFLLLVHLNNFSIPVGPSACPAAYQTYTALRNKTFPYLVHCPGRPGFFCSTALFGAVVNFFLPKQPKINKEGILCVFDNCPSISLKEDRLWPGKQWNATSHMTTYATSTMSAWIWGGMKTASVSSNTAPSPPWPQPETV